VLEDTIGWLYAGGWPKHRWKLKPAYELTQEAPVGMFLIFGADWGPSPDRDRYTEPAPDRDRDRALGPGGSVPTGGADAHRGERPEPPEPGILHDDGVSCDPERERRPNPVALADEVAARADDPELGLA